MITSLERETKSLIGFEGEPNTETLLTLMMGILNGNEFSPIEVYDFNRYYELPWPVLKRPPEGGHHRAIAHFLLGKPLSIDIVTTATGESVRAMIPRQYRIDLMDIIYNRTWFSDPRQFCYRQKYGEFLALPHPDEYFDYRDAFNALFLSPKQYAKIYRANQRFIKKSRAALR